MIQPNELRLGNWVYDCKYTQFPMQVVAIGSDYVYLDFEGNEGDLWECDSKEIEPIPLTEGLVTTQGWEKVCYLYTDLNGLEIYETNDGWHLHIDDDKCQTAVALLVKYVHELQNAYFVATKKELEVKL